MGGGSSKPKVLTLSEALKDKNQLKKFRLNAEKQFKEADKDNNNYLDTAEFEQSCRDHNKKYNFPEPSETDVKQALAQYDKNHDGKLSMSEYQNMIIEVLKIIALAKEEQEKKLQENKTSKK